MDGSGPRHTGALEGLTVLDLTQMLSGPFASMLLADQGARVIKIEPPGGETTRRVGPFLEGQTRMEEGGYGSYFASINRNKESIVVDLKSPDGIALFKRLTARADVVIENFRAGVTHRLGLDYETLARDNPRLVVAALRGFGDPASGESPYAAWPAYDPVAQAMGGIMGITGPVPGGAPTKIGPGVGDLVPALFMAFGIVSAVLSARASGRGQFVDVAMVDGVLAVCERLVYQHSATGDVPGPEGDGHPLLCPFGLFKAKDGYVSLGIPKDEFWGPFCAVIGAPHLGDDPRYRLNADRVARRDEVNGIVTAFTTRHTKAELLEIFGGRIPFGPVLRADEIFADPHFAARGMLPEVEVPGASRPLTVAGTPVHMSRTPGGVRRRAPLTGEDTDRILADFGFDEAERQALQAAGAVA
ncbi:CaiB/BaiF CoA-transferase family protein [Acuticoccus sp. I52.16.1]|uniref:CaiB/BaiF CoA transferase family protein n=1 Tax=Acuticoccus sp. I52.16.1 TaxID=2928472 RepID=UPI001FD3C85E|nr:CoA transferase [Acuticoccus sp. I52.16.1]UOM34828.1 CoA transferase [Acuticoccus sp. I52.16.1]